MKPISLLKGALFAAATGVALASADAQAFAQSAPATTISRHYDASSLTDFDGFEARNWRYENRGRYGRRGEARENRYGRGWRGGSGGQYMPRNVPLYRNQGIPGGDH